MMTKAGHFAAEKARNGVGREILDSYLGDNAVSVTKTSQRNIEGAIYFL